MRNRKRRKKRWQQDVTLSFGVIASIESHNNADNKLECCLHSVFKVFSVLSMRLESDVDHLFFKSNNSRTKHKTVKGISKHHLMILFIFIKIIMIIITAIMIVLTVTTFSKYIASVSPLMGTKQFYKSGLKIQFLLHKSRRRESLKCV